MTIKKQLLLYGSALLLMFTACEDNEAADEDNVVTIETPTAYTFDSRFNDGESSVSYSGQVVRNLLINDIKGLIADNVGGGNTATINSMMANDDANLGIIAVGDMNTVQTKYHDISSSQLNDRLASVTSYTDPGYGANAQDMIAGWVAESEYYSVRPSGVDLGQMAQKVMWGAIAYCRVPQSICLKYLMMIILFLMMGIHILQWNITGMNRSVILEQLVIIIQATLMILIVSLIPIMTQMVMDLLTSSLSIIWAGQ